MIAYRFHSLEPDGSWTSEPFTAADRRQIVQGVIAGFLSGRPRWATTLDGEFIYGLDARGRELRAAPLTCADCDQAIQGEPIYFMGTSARCADCHEARMNE